MKGKLSAMPVETEEVIRRGVRRAIFENELTAWRLNDAVGSAVYRDPQSDKVTVHLIDFDDRTTMDVDLDLAAIVDRFGDITVEGVADEFARVYHQKA
jgi:hypothetical protein